MTHAAMQIPATRGGAIDLLVAQDVARWGERDREMCLRYHGRHSLGILLSDLATRAEIPGENPGALARALRAAANRAMTDADRHELSQRGRIGGGR